VNSVLNLRVPWNAGKLSSGLTSSGISSSTQLHIVSYLSMYQRRQNSTYCSAFSESMLNETYWNAYQSVEKISTTFLYSVDRVRIQSHCDFILCRSSGTYNSVALVHQRTIPTERSPIVGVSANFLWIEGCRVVSTGDPYGHNLGFLDRSCYVFFHVAIQL
jgi:hypothetical protein